MAIFLNEPQRYDVAVDLRTIWWGFVSENLARCCTSISRVSLVKNFFRRNFRKFSSAKIFWRKVSRKKIFSRKDAYWVTWLHMKRLGHRACTTWATAAEIAKKAGFGHFWPNPQIGFWAILGRGCVGAGWQHMKKTCEPRLHAPTPTNTY